MFVHALQTGDPPLSPSLPFALVSGNLCAIDGRLFARYKKFFAPFFSNSSLQIRSTAFTSIIVSISLVSVIIRDHIWNFICLFFFFKYLYDNIRYLAEYKIFAKKLQLCPMYRGI